MSSAVIKSLYESFLDLLYEHKCPFEIEHLCSNRGHCSSDSWGGGVCSFCFNELVDLELKPRKDLNGIEDVFSAAEYKNEAKTIIQKFKWSNPGLAKPIAELINFKLSHLDEEINFDYIIPVPGIANEDRNWVPSQLIAKELSSLLKIPLIEPLEKIQETKLHKLNKESRKKAVRESYKVKASHDHSLKNYALSGKKLLLVDDLVTSGATLEVCAELLKQINSDNEVSGVTFASVG